MSRLTTATTLAAAGVVLCAFVGCGATASTRFPADVATALRRDSMRRMETQSLVLYYPSHRKADAQRIAQRLEGCTEALRRRARISNGYALQKFTIVVPDVPFNNAFVSPNVAGNEAFSVIPTSNSFDFTTELGLPSDPSYVGCHEIVHYVQTLQLAGFWRWGNEILGALLSTQLGLDSWFAEGIATYYESQLQPDTGRMAWPVWRGSFHAGYAGKRISGGDLSSAQRPFTWGHHYLTGSHFVAFIADRYGEDALWKLVERQGGSLFFPLGVALRWKSATGSSLPALLGEFSDYVAKEFPRKTRPTAQRVVREVGESARYAVAPTGREALIVRGGDHATTLRIYDGERTIRSRKLTDILWPRKLTAPNPTTISGLSFAGDGKLLYFVALEMGSIVQRARLIRYRIDDDSLDVVVERLGGPGGGVNRNGTAYYYSYADGDRHHLSVIDLSTKARRNVRQAEAQTYYGTSTPSPSGKQIASSVFDGSRHTVRIVDSTTGHLDDEITPPGAIHDPRWINETQLIVLVEVDRIFQAHTYDLPSRVLTQVSHAPYLAFQARPHLGAIRFLNREGWSYTVDEVALGQVAPLTADQTTLPAADAANGVAIDASSRRAATQKLQVSSDTAYRHTDRLFYPSIRLPFLISPSEDVQLLGFSVQGSDRLSFHNWTAFGLYDFRGGEISGGVSYASGLLAPFVLRLALERYAWNNAERLDTEIRAGRFRVQQRGYISLSRSFRDLDAALTLSGVEDSDADNPTELLRDRRLAGPRLELSHSAVEATAYGGIRRGLRIAGSAAFYSRALSSFDENIADVGGSLTLWGPLPLSRRHGLTASLRGRRLFGLDRRNGFLEIGGFDPLFRSVSGRPDDFEGPEVGETGVPDQLSFSERLRGFEDLPFLTDRIAVAQLAYRYPLILDVGVSSVAYLLPSLFARQLDLELFAVGATDSFKSLDTHRKFAAGASAALQLQIWIVPLKLRYQLARRFTDDDALVHTISLGTI